MQQLAQPAAAIWKLDSSVARLTLERAKLAVNPLNPAAGLFDIEADRVSLALLHPLNVAMLPVSSEGLEVYVRGADLVATYSRRPEPAMRTQIYWRAAQDAEAVIFAIELLVSTQTSLLDSCPRLNVTSKIAASEVLRLNDARPGTFSAIDLSDASIPKIDSSVANCHLFRLAESNFSYIEMAEPAAIESSTLTSQLLDSSHRICLSHRLFAERLEKGVILRARVRGVLVDRDGDELAASRHYQSLLREELPLTA